MLALCKRYKLAELYNAIGTVNNYSANFSEYLNNTKK